MSSQFIKAEGVGLGQNSVSRVCVSVQFAPPPSSKMRSGDRSLRQIHVRVSRMFDWKFSTKFRIRKGGEEKRTCIGEGNYSLFHLFAIILIKDSSFKNCVENRVEFKVKRIFTRRSKDKTCLLVSSNFLKEKKGGGRGRKKCLERLFGFSHVPR